MPNFETPDRDRTKEANKSFIFMDIQITDDPSGEKVLDKVDAWLSSVEADLAGARLLPGMVGYEFANAKDGESGFALFTPGMESGEVEGL